MRKEEVQKDSLEKILFFLHIFQRKATYGNEV